MPKNLELIDLKADEAQREGFVGAERAGAEQELEGAAIKGNLRLHMICALTSALLILFLSWMRSRLRTKDRPPSIPYWGVTLIALFMITLTGHLGGVLSGVEMS